MKRNLTMGRSLSIESSAEIRPPVDDLASDNDSHSAPREYPHDLNCRDSERSQVHGRILCGLNDIRNNRFASETVEGIINEFV